MYVRACFWLHVVKYMYMYMQGRYLQQICNIILKAINLQLLKFNWFITLIQARCASFTFLWYVPNNLSRMDTLIITELGPINSAASSCTFFLSNWRTQLNIGWKQLMNLNSFDVVETVHDKPTRFYLLYTKHFVSW